jgi:UDP-N-acetyl-D-mannosaminuronic acid transferase (WecB/TagA/CpsF family)
MIKLEITYKSGTEADVFGISTAKMMQNHKDHQQEGILTAANQIYPDRSAAC